MNKLTATGLIAANANDRLKIEISVEGYSQKIKMEVAGAVAGDFLALKTAPGLHLYNKGREWDGQSPKPQALVAALAPQIEEARAKLTEALKALEPDMVADILKGHGFSKGGVSSGGKTPRGQSGRAAAKPNAAKFPVGTKIKQTATGDTWSIVGHSPTHYKLKNGSQTRDIQRFNKQWVPQKG